MKLTKDQLYEIYAEYNKKYFSGQLPSVEIKTTEALKYHTGTLGTTRMRVLWDRLKQQVRMEPIVIHLKAGLLNNELIARRTLLHEMIHVYQFNKLRPLYLKAKSEAEATEISENTDIEEGHGPDFVELMNLINKKEGKGFISIKQEEDLPAEVETKKEYYLYIEPKDDKVFMYQPHFRVTKDLKDKVVDKKNRGAKLVKTDEPLFLKEKIKNYEYYLTKDVEQFKAMDKIYKSNTSIAATEENPVGCLMLDLKDCDNKEQLLDLFKQVQEQIPSGAILEKHPYSEGDGLERQPHVTVFYGLKDKSPVDEIKEKVINLDLPFTFVGIDKFDDKPEYDVLKITVESQALTDLHYWIRNKFDNICTYPYNAHSTLAYVKKGSCDHLLGKCLLSGHATKPNSLVLSYKGDEKINLPIFETSKVQAGAFKELAILEKDLIAKFHEDPSFDTAWEVAVVQHQLDGKPQLHALKDLKEELKEYFAELQTSAFTLYKYLILTKGADLIEPFELGTEWSLSSKELPAPNVNKDELSVHKVVIKSNPFQLDWIYTLKQALISVNNPAVYLLRESELVLESVEPELPVLMGSSVFAKLEDWSNQWVHYSKIPEIKVNPQTMFRDPAGIYLFPKEFKTVGAWTTYPYKFNVTIKQGLNILDLAKLTKQDCLDLWTKLGLELTEELKARFETNNYLDTWWEALTERHYGKQGLFNKRFRALGYDAIFDDTGSIHNSEVQLLLLHKGAIEQASIEDLDLNLFKNFKMVLNDIAETCSQFGSVEVSSVKKANELYSKNKNLEAQVVCTSEPVAKYFDAKDYAVWKLTARVDAVETSIKVYLSSDSKGLKSIMSRGGSVILRRDGTLENLNEVLEEVRKVTESALTPEVDSNEVKSSISLEDFITDFESLVKPRLIQLAMINRNFECNYNLELFLKKFLLLVGKQLSTEFGIPDSYLIKKPEYKKDYSIFINSKASLSLSKVLAANKKQQLDKSLQAWSDFLNAGLKTLSTRHAWFDPHVFKPVVTDTIENLKEHCP